MAMPLSVELWRPASRNPRPRPSFREEAEEEGWRRAPPAPPMMAAYSCSSVLDAGVSAPLEVGVEVRDAMAPEAPGPSAEGVAGRLEDSGQRVRRLPRLVSEWLASEDELEMLQSSPAVDVL